ncbi:TadE/TadG family type IV pilus assembly protein [Marimonas arenosa]|uniref:Pilus assembly protein n=1 Tax=Marimonas arenosa TaxID=1795305 RepID=A0AAE3WDB6_9RHOB|nr:TadE family protein [Marimonas arenosa]MDQ2089687.1 pilus assembly protein [Marimonas arenosa]
MSCLAIISRRATRGVKGFWRDDSAATLVEFALSIALMLFLLLGIIDFGRLAFHYVAAEKFVQHAARIAAVRPPACGGVPETYTRGTAGDGPRFGTSCRAGVGICVNPGPITCTATPDDPTSQEVWAFLQVALPDDATMNNVVFRYDYDPDLGFLGGPYVPLVTVELTGLTFDFIAPLSELAALIIGETTNMTESLGGSITFPALSASVPGEDLALGTNG